MKIKVTARVSKRKNAIGPPPPPPVTQQQMSPPAQTETQKGPTWVHNPNTQDSIGAVGMAEPNSMGDLGQQRTKAEHEAKEKLIQTVAGHIKGKFPNINEQSLVIYLENNLTFTHHYTDSDGNQFALASLSNNIYHGIMQNLAKHKKGFFNKKKSAFDLKAFDNINEWAKFLIQHYKIGPQGVEKEVANKIHKLLTEGKFEQKKTADGYEYTRKDSKYSFIWNPKDGTMKVKGGEAEAQPAKKEQSVDEKLEDVIEKFGLRHGVDAKTADKIVVWLMRQGFEIKKTTNYTYENPNSKYDFIFDSKSRKLSVREK